MNKLKKKFQKKIQNQIKSNFLKPKNMNYMIFLPIQFKAYINYNIDLM